MFSRRPSSSSSASRNTWLSSTSRTRIRGATRGRLFRGQEERVVGLPAALDVDLELRMPGPDCLQERTELRFLVAGQERQDASRLDEEPFDDGGGTSSERGPPGHGRAAARAGKARDG